MNDQIPQEEPLLGQSFEWYNKNNPITNRAHFCVGFGVQPPVGIRASVQESVRQVSLEQRTAETFR